MVSKRSKTIAKRKNASKQAAASTVKKVAKAVARNVVRESAKRKEPKPFFEPIGRRLGGFFGPVGAELGSAAGSIIGKITGMGDYTVRRNTLVAGSNVPTFSKSGESTVITHREFVTDIFGSAGFASNTYQITPTNSALFPWLSTIAGNYQQYEIMGMIFEYKSTSGTAINSSNASLGTVVMTTQYDPIAPVFTSRRSAENYEYTTQGAPYASIIHPCECKPSLTNFPIKFTSSVDDPDDRLVNFGTFQLITEGMPTNTLVGELWVSYQIKFIKPQLNTVPSTNYLNMSGRINNGDAINNNWTQTNCVVSSIFNDGTVYYQISSSKLFFTKPGVFMFLSMSNCNTAGSSVQFYIDGANVVSSNNVVMSGDAQVNWLSTTSATSSSASLQLYPAATAAGVGVAYVHILNASAGKPEWITIKNGRVGTADCFVNMSVVQMPTGVANTNRYALNQSPPGVITLSDDFVGLGKRQRRVDRMQEEIDLLTNKFEGLSSIKELPETPGGETYVMLNGVPHKSIKQNKNI